ncbi:MAG: biopolymer transporter ExbD, partial [Planctomycetota bacterium]
LLIFFMLTASFDVQRALRIPPPDPEQKGVTQSLELEDLTEDSVIVTIEPDGDGGDRLFVDDAELDSPDAIVAELAAAMRDGRRGELVVVADDESRHATVVAVVDAGQSVGMERIRLAAPP